MNRAPTAEMMIMAQATPVAAYSAARLRLGRRGGKLSHLEFSHQPLQPLDRLRLGVTPMASTLLRNG